MSGNSPPNKEVSRYDEEDDDEQKQMRDVLHEYLDRYTDGYIVCRARDGPKVFWGARQDRLIKSARNSNSSAHKLPSTLKRPNKRRKKRSN